MELKTWLSIILKHVHNFSSTKERGEKYDKNNHVYKLTKTLIKSDSILICQILVVNNL